MRGVKHDGSKHGGGYIGETSAMTGHKVGGHRSCGVFVNLEQLTPSSPLLTSFKIALLLLTSDNSITTCRQGYSNNSHKTHLIEVGSESYAVSH